MTLLATARRQAFAAALHRPTLRRLAVDKDLRVAARAAFSVVVACCLAIASPRLVLVASPLVLGIPHLAMEALVLWRRARPPSIALPVGALVAVALAVAARVGGEAALGFAVVAVASCMARRPLLAVALGAAAIASLLVPAVAEWALASVVASHALVTLAAWILLFRPKRKRLYAAPAVVLVVVGLAAVLFARGPIVALAYLQGVHYATWLAVVPDDASSGRGAPTVTMQIRAFRRTFGVVGTAVVGAALVASIAASLVLGAETARDAYLGLARWHVWLELGVVTLLTRRR